MTLVTKTPPSLGASDATTDRWTLAATAIPLPYSKLTKRADVSAMKCHIDGATELLAAVCRTPISEQQLAGLDCLADRCEGHTELSPIL